MIPHEPARRSSGRLRPALAALALGAVALGATAQRDTLVRLLPGAAPVFAIIGLPVNLRGLAIRHVTGTLLASDAAPVLAVTGEIANIRTAPRSVPEIRIAVRGADGRDLYTWTAAAPKAELAAGETIAFRTRLATPPAGARDVVVRFVETASASAGSSKTARR